MKDWLNQQLTGEGPLTDALRDILWIMPWWLPYLLITWVAVWLLLVWFSRRRDRRHTAPRTTSRRSGEGVIHRRRDRVRGLV